MMLNSSKSKVELAYDAAIESASIDMDSVRWESRTILSVEINGTRYSARVETMTEAGVKAALSDCLAKHCAVTAARNAA